MTEHYKNLSLESIEGEVWRDIEDFEGFYQVSNMGRVKSLERKITIIGKTREGYEGKRKERIIKQNSYNFTWVGTGKNRRAVSVNKLLYNIFSIESKPGTKLSKYNGVYCTFSMRINTNGKMITKYFKTELEAAKAYDFQVKKNKLNRELNFPDDNK